ncbi:UNVERIFIED_CONTAM: Retrovirus-related Pol polyprotein from type-2 retrotransposable element R2DM [Sesamum radiatum]|uniref:Retrovirus-related Pol polyprotein from type-2 retrotransposable element R2DM n=1 Tax=Sesamum radiatum TaxID=300843 RepID=A0AAW2J471_SESRA
MSLRRQKHLQVPVWVRFRHLPLEYWTAEGLSAVASGIGSPLYTDKVTQACSRLDYARVCVMLDYHSKLPKHLVVISPMLREGKEVPIKVDIEYEWLPMRCTQCCSLGHNVKSCPESRVKKAAASVSVFVQKQNSTQVATSSPGVDLEADVESDLNADGDMVNSSAKQGDNKPVSPQLFPTFDNNGSTLPTTANGVSHKGKEVVVYNPFEILGNEQTSLDEEGLNSVGHQEAVGQLVLEHNIQFLGLLETRVRQVNINSVRSNLLRNWSWFDDYSGPGGRIWLVWNAVDVDVEVLRVETQFIHCKVTNKAMHTTCLMTVVYGECDIIPRRELWAGLCLLSGSLSDEPWCVLGDFNAVIDASEICGTSADVSNAMAEFQDCITAAALVHLSFTGCLFSWHNCREGSSSLWKRLDRILINAAWLTTWPNSKYICALPSTSDHSPLILSGYDRGMGRGTFRFANFLAKQPGFLSSVWSIWRHNIHGTQMFGVVNKLKSLKPIFRAQRKVKGDLSKNVQQAKVFLDKAQVLFDVYKEGLLLQLVKMCQVLYCVSVKQERSMLQQRAKLNWLKDGDQCTKVFFRKINTRRARQHIHQIMDSTGELKSEPSQVVSEFVSYYQTLLGGVRNNRALDLSFLQPGLKHILTMEEANGLVSAVSLDEIKEAFFDISEDSAQDRMAIHPLFSRQLGLSLGGTMQQVLPLLIDCSQNAFIPGRSIADNVMLAQELLSGYNLKRLPPRCTIKVDIQKAYDSVSWDFVLEGLRIFNFPSSFIGWIEQCITTVTYSVSLNGSIHGFFQGARGIRQGDPMSPYLFVIVMELWHVLLKLRVQNSDRFLYHWKCRELGILNLCFADDVLIFCSADTQSASIIKQSLAEFAILSGLQVNPHKSQVILSKSVQSERQAILDIMGYQAGMLPIKYLGVPLVASRLSIEDCKPLLHKIDKRLAGWGQLTLSFAGRTQLIKSVLSSLHMARLGKVLPKSHGRKYANQRRKGGLGLEGLRNQSIWTYHSSNSSWCWKKLIKLSSLMRPGLDYQVGDGQQFMVWTDIWHPQGPLLRSFPRGPSITGLPADSLLRTVMLHGTWNWPSECDFDIQDIISSLPIIHPNQPDTIKWRTRTGNFTTAAAFAMLQPPSPSFAGAFDNDGSYLDGATGHGLCAMWGIAFGIS